VNTRWLGALCAIVVALTFVDATSVGAASSVVCNEGAGPGACKSPAGLAIDPVSGDLYVADTGNDRIDAFASSGGLQFSFTTPLPERYLAVDGDPTSSSYGDLYAGTADYKVEKFDKEGHLLGEFGTQGTGECELASGLEDPIAVGPEGTVDVLDAHSVGMLDENRIEKFTAAGACAGQLILSRNEDPAYFGFAVDASGNFYAYIAGIKQIVKFAADGAEQCSAEPGWETQTLAVDAAEDLLAIQYEASSGYYVLTEFGAGCKVTRRFGYGGVQAPGGMDGVAAQAPDIDGVYVSAYDGVARLETPPPGPIAVPASVKASAGSIGNSRAIVQAEVNPEGVETEYRFQYVTRQSYEEQGNSFTGASTKESVVETLGGDFVAHRVTATIGCADPVLEVGSGNCLQPETEYLFRVVATNANGSGEGTVVSSFVTNKPFEALGVWSEGVSLESATLRAEINPLGLPTSSFFEYVSEAQFQASGFADATRAPAAGVLDFGSGEGPVTHGVTISELSPGVDYRYRLVTDDPLLSGAIASEPLTLRTFATPGGIGSCPGNEVFRIGASATLPDCRAYEMVSPVNKENGNIRVIGEATTALPATLDEAAVGGEELTYGSYRPFGGAASGALTSQYIASRGASGWTSQAISPPRARLDLGALGTLDNEFRMFSPDLCDAWLATVAEPPLAPGAVQGYSNLYRRQNEGCGQEGYEAVTTVAPMVVKPQLYRVELDGVSADGTEALFTAPENLAGTEAPALAALGEEAREVQLYAHTSEALRFVCILPDGAPSETGCAAGTVANDGHSRFGSVQNAISADGQRVYWSSHESYEGTGRLYLRLNPMQKQSRVAAGECTQVKDACTLDVSREAEESAGAEKSTFWLASEDGGTALFSVESASGGGVSDLYKFTLEDAAGKPTTHTTLIAHKALGVMGASENAEWVYFASEEALTGEEANSQGAKAATGQPNLYVDHEGAVKFIGVLARGEFHRDHAAISLQPVYRASRVSASGHDAVFMSFADMTSYDNADAANGAADAEVYEYDAMADGGEGLLRCISCIPTGARPVGRNIAQENAPEERASGLLPGWEDMFYGPRVLSEDGSRVFFDSFDALTLRDSDGVEDVYEWERPGTGSCTEADSAYSVQDEGCIYLISLGTSPADSELVDASPSGSDVFIRTLSSLVPQDPGLVDIYDARVEGGFPSPPAAPAECEGEACQSPPSAPIDATPASAVFEGPGNVVAPKSASNKPKSVRRSLSKKSKKKSKKKSRRKSQRARPGARRGSAQQRRRPRSEEASGHTDREDK
jgi:hypothetical protein